jgi:hypothetical protein
MQHSEMYGEYMLPQTAKFYENIFFNEMCNIYITFKVLDTLSS